MFIDFEYLFWGKSFGLEIWHKCYQRRGDLMIKVSWQKKKNSVLGRVLKLAAMNFFSHLHMLVDFEYLFCVNLLALKFCKNVINIEMLL